MPDGRASVNIPESIHNELKVKAAQRRVTMQQAVEKALRIWLLVPGERLDQLEAFAASLNGEPLEIAFQILDSRSRASG